MDNAVALVHGSVRERHVTLIIHNAAIADAEALEKAIARVGGVTTVHVNPLRNSVRIDYDPAAFRSCELLATVETVRFNVTGQHSQARPAGLN